MSCMCGDLQCPSCGPAQGNWRCIICGMWADDPCEHMAEEGQGSDNNRWGNYKPEFHAQCEEEARKVEEGEALVEKELREEYHNRFRYER